MTDFFQLSFADIDQLHFIRPWWFAGLLPLILLWFVKTKTSQQTDWFQVLPNHLASVLLKQSGQVRRNRFITLLFAWCLSCIALAGPTWQKIEKPVFKIKRASVILLDMSLSMRSTDIKPNRLTKSKFKAMDLTSAIGDGDVALVAYAGDAFTIAPLTPDARNLNALIPSLSPEIMPEKGSYPLLGLEKAAELLTQAGYLSGDIFWFTDGIEQEDWNELQQFASDTPYRINILAIGTAQGAPIKLTDNSLLKDHTGSIVIPKLNKQPLSRLAGLTSGVFVNTTANDSDIKRLANVQPQSKAQNEQESDEDKLLTGDDWQEFGPYLLILLLPFVLMKFRRGAALSVAIPLVLLIPEQRAIAETAPIPANPPSQPAPESSWTDFIFETKDQIANEQYAQGQYQQAQNNFQHEQWKAAAAFKSGDFETALNYFDQDKSARGFYNKGNALAHLNKIDEAITAYEEALKLQPDFQNAEENKALLEQLKQNQQQNNQDQNSEQNSSDQQNQNQQQDSEQQDSQQNSQNNEQKNQQSQSQDNQQSESKEPTANEQSEQNSESKQESQKQQQNEQEQKTQNTGKPEQQEQQGEQQAVTPLTPEQLAEKEQQQKLQQLLRKVTDDPATLLRNKMILENRKRQQSKRTPKGAQKQW